MARDYQRKSNAEMKAILQREFKHPFSVRKSHGTSYRWTRITWTDGPTEKAVREFCGKFNDTEGDDIMTDLWVGSQYTNETRNYSSPWVWYLVSEIDLRNAAVTLAEQIDNYARVLNRRYASNADIRWGDTDVTIKPRNGCYAALDGIDHVVESLEAQGYKCTVSADQTSLSVV